MTLQSKLFQKCILNSMRAITNSVMSHHHEKWALHCVGKRCTGGDVNSVILQGDWNRAEVAPRFCPYKFLLQSLFMRYEYKVSKYGIRYLLLYSKTSGHGAHTYKSLKWDWEIWKVRMRWSGCGYMRISLWGWVFTLVSWSMVTCSPDSGCSLPILHSPWTNWHRISSYNSYNLNLRYPRETDELKWMRLVELEDPMERYPKCWLGFKGSLLLFTRV